MGSPAYVVPSWVEYVPSGCWVTGSADSATAGMSAYITSTVSTVARMEAGMVRSGTCASSAMFDTVSMPV